MTAKAILFDIDGTLVDSNQHHVLAWDEAFRNFGRSFSQKAIHDQIGKGSDNLIPALIADADEAMMEKLSAAHADIYQSRFLATVKPFPRARDLLVRTHEAGCQVILASSAPQEEVKHYLELLEVRDLVTATTSSDDVERTKPAPDIFAAALAKVGSTKAEDAVVVGDSPYDMEAAARCGIGAAIAVRSGKFPDNVLWATGASALYDDVAAILGDFDRSPIGG